MITADLFRRRIDASLKAVASLHEQVDQIAAAAECVVECLRADGTVYTAGNGGSAAQAMHLAEELIGRYRSSRAPLRAVCLNADPTALTCIANDFGFDEVFARQCEALLRPGDVLVALSTSGRSHNIQRALEIAQLHNARSIGLLGDDGGPCADLCTHALIVGAGQRDSALIQDAHQVIVHLICELAEMKFTAAAQA